MHKFTTRRRRGFTLIELIVVVVVLGILAAVATPKFLNTSDTARDNASKQSLSVLRNAIETFRTETGGYPTAANITTDLADYIRGDFPAPGIGANGSSNAVAATSSNPPSAATGSSGWLYNQTVGDIWINDDSYLTY